MPKYRLLQPQVVGGIPRPAGFEIEIDGSLRPDHPRAAPSVAYQYADELFGVADSDSHEGWRIAADPVAPEPGNLGAAVAALRAAGWKTDREQGSLISPSKFSELVTALNDAYREGIREERAQSRIPNILRDVGKAWETYRGGIAEYRNALDAVESRLGGQITELMKVIGDEFYRQVD